MNTLNGKTIKGIAPHENLSEFGMRKIIMGNVFNEGNAQSVVTP